MPGCPRAITLSVTRLVRADGPGSWAGTFGAMDGGSEPLSCRARRSALAVQRSPAWTRPRCREALRLSVGRRALRVPAAAARGRCDAVPVARGIDATGSARRHGRLGLHAQDRDRLAETHDAGQALVRHGADSSRRARNLSRRHSRPAAHADPEHSFDVRSRGRRAFRQAGRVLRDRRSVAGRSVRRTLRQAVPCRLDEPG